MKSKKKNTKSVNGDGSKTAEIVNKIYATQHHTDI